MIRCSLRKFVLVASTLLVPVALVGCEENKGPAEKAGENMDKAGRNIKDAVDPPKTTGEKAGDAVDKAVGNK